MASKTVPQRLKAVENQVANLNRKVEEQDRVIYDLRHPADNAANTLVSGLAETVIVTRKSSMEKVEERVCFLNGHRIGLLERQVPNPDLPDPSKTFHKTTVTKQEILCLQCGRTLDEIRRAQ